MYSPRQVLRGIRDPHVAALHLNRRISDAVLTKLRPPTNFFEEDWDNLLLLDACRHDMVSEERLDGEGTLEYRWSPGSNSEEFVQFHVDRQVLDDVVWVTGNPWVSQYGDRIFETVDLWDTGWDDELQTIPPEPIRDAAIEAEEEHPDKRLVVHFMQPHFPFIGEFGRERIPSHRTFDGDGLMDTDPEGKTIWQQLEDGDVSRSDVWQAYRENLDVVFPVARELCEELTGKCVVSADHGNELGGRAFPFPIRLYGHPSGLRTKNLVKVPWIVYEGEQRKEISAGDTTGSAASDDDEVVEDRLRALGYKK